MELLQLRYFLDSADNENFSKTAEKYGIPPSGVSVAVKKLEQELGCTLFTRENNRVKLNARGRVLRGAVRGALEQIDRAVTELSEITTEETGKISLLVRCERRIVGEHLLAFKKLYPHVDFRVSHEFSTQDIEKYDIIIDASGEKYAGFEGIPLFSDELYFAARGDNPLCGRKLTLRDLRDQPFVTLLEGSSLKQLVEDACKKAGFHPHVIIESDDPYYLRKYIEMDLGIALVPEKSWAGELSDHIDFLNVTDFKYTRVTYAYFNKARSHNSAATNFFRLLAENAET